MACCIKHWILWDPNTGYPITRNIWILDLKHTWGANWTSPFYSVNIHFKSCESKKVDLLSQTKTNSSNILDFKKWFFCRSRTNLHLLWEIRLSLFVVPEVPRLGSCWQSGTPWPEGKHLSKCWQLGMPWQGGKHRLNCNAAARYSYLARFFIPNTFKL